MLLEERGGRGRSFKGSGTALYDFLALCKCCMTTRANIEFMVMHNFFIETHTLPLDFDFPKYVYLISKLVVVLLRNLDGCVVCRLGSVA